MTGLPSPDNVADGDDYHGDVDGDDNDAHLRSFPGLPSPDISIKMLEWTFMKRRKLVSDQSMKERCEHDNEKTSGKRETISANPGLGVSPTWRGFSCFFILNFKFKFESVNPGLGVSPTWRGFSCFFI